MDVRFNRYTDSAQPNRVAPRSNMSNMLPRSALSAGSLDALGAKRGFTTDCQDGNLLDAAAHLFAALRRLDASKLDRVVMESVPETGMGRAIMDRLRRAAARG